MAYKNIEDRRKHDREYKREMRAWLKAHYLCVECKQQDAYTLNGHRCCFECYAKHRKTPIEYIKPKPQPKEPSKRREPGYCYLCGAKAKQGESNWTGKPFAVCEKHWMHMKKIAERGTASYKAKHGETWGQTEFRRRNPGKADRPRKSE